MKKITTKEELQAVLRLCQEFLAESRYGHMALSAQKMIMLLDYAQAHDRWYTDYKMNKEGECVGILVGRVDELFFTHATIAQDVMFYVREDYRGSPWFVKALKQFEAWAKEKGAIEMKLSPNSGINSDKMTKLYTRLGYNSAGYIFSKEF